MASSQGDSRDVVGASGSPVPTHLAMVVLAAADLPGLRRFYRELGWIERDGSSDSLTRFSLDNLDLTLYPATTPAPAGSEGPATVTLVLAVGTRAGVDDAATRVLHAGGRSVSQPTDQPWGGRSAVIADPEGNQWELLWMDR
jgi:uncharacterized protein